MSEFIHTIERLSSKYMLLIITAYCCNYVNVSIKNKYVTLLQLICIKLYSM